jgi:hypothetical protein
MQDGQYSKLRPVLRAENGEEPDALLQVLTFCPGQHLVGELQKPANRSKVSLIGAPAPLQTHRISYASNIAHRRAMRYGSEMPLKGGLHK